MRWLVVALLPAVLLFLRTPLMAVRVSVDFENIIGTNKLTYGFNEVDRMTYFAGTAFGFTNTTILQNHQTVGTKIIRVFLTQQQSQSFQDAYIRAVINCGAVPMVCFQNMPPAGTYDSFGNWCAGVMTRYKGLYNISGWYWELINEPNNVGVNLADYITLYNTVEPKLHAVDPGARVGGPATAGLNSYWITSLLSSARPNGVQFISWHRYGCWAKPDPGPSDAELLAQTPRYGEDVDVVQYLIDLYRPGSGIRKVVGELGVNAWAGDLNGTWNTDVRIKTVFNDSYYSSVIRHLMFSQFGNQADVEMMWEGTGDDYEGGSRGFGLWYAQQPTKRAPAFFAKKFVTSYFPAGASLVKVDDGATSTLEAVGCKAADGKYNLLLINKTTSSTPVTVTISGITVSSVTCWTLDSTSPEGSESTLPASTYQNITLNGYGIKILSITGSPVSPQIRFTSIPKVSDITSTSAVIKWDTDLDSTSEIDYGLAKSYGYIAGSGDLVRSHQVLLTNLLPGTVYHFRVRSANSGAGFGSTTSINYVFTTKGEVGRLVNGGFESGLINGWTRYGNFDDDGNLGVTQAPWRFNITPHGGTYFLGSAASYGSKSGGYYQQVTVRPGKYYRLTGWINTYNQGGASSDTNCRIGLDPAGGTNQNAPSIVWTAREHSSLTWKQLDLTVQATGPKMTVFLDAQQLYGVAWNINAFDDIVLTECSVSGAKWMPSGSDVTLMGVVCTAGTSQMGGSFFYVEDDDRTSGIKVNSTAQVKEGDLVNVSGKITLLNSERYINTPTSLSILSSNNEVPAPFVMQNMAVGGAGLNIYTPGVTGGVGPNNIGLLITVVGRVTYASSVAFWVDDGSGVIDGSIKGMMIESGSLSEPVVGEYVAVTGISTVRYRNNGWRRTLKPRKQSDILQFN